MSAWESTLEGMKEQPSDDMLETLLLAQLEKDTEISSLIALYKQDINQRGTPRSYDTLMSMINTELAERRRKQVRDAKAGKGGGAHPAVDNNHCRSMAKTGKCPRGDACPYNHVDALKAFKKGGGKSGSQERGRDKGRDKGDKGGKGREKKKNSSHSYRVDVSTASPARLEVNKVWPRWYW